MYTQYLRIYIEIFVDVEIILFNELLHFPLLLIAYDGIS